MNVLEHWQADYKVDKEMNVHKNSLSIYIKMVFSMWM